MITERNLIKNRIVGNGIDKSAKIGIYGTGAGAEEIYEFLQELSLSDQLVSVIDRNDANQMGKEKFGKTVCTIAEAAADVDIILVGARMNHIIVAERIYEYCKDTHKNIKIIDPFEHKNTLEDKVEFIEYLEKKSRRENPEFVDISATDFKRKETDTKLVAWYLPQYYEIEINNRYYGRGFTEWTNSTQTMPQFCGHYQPHIPYDVGYYTLTNIETMKRQVYLAKRYGIYGFCFHYYWFSGKRIMEKPVSLFLEHKEINMPFCINWANENWTCAWDGGNKDLIYEQLLLPEDDEKFLKDILPILQDERYITIEGKPVLIIYRSDIFAQERFLQLLQNLRKLAIQNGFPDLYIMITTATRNTDDVRKWGADALVEFPPHRIAQYSEKILPDGYINPNFKGTIYDAASMIEEKAYLCPHESSSVMRGIMTSYDNTARRGLSAAGIFYGIEPQPYKIWLKDILLESKQRHNKEEDFIFINAWNEWAEGAHLEPDMKYGYAYLQATRDALEEVRT